MTRYPKLSWRIEFPCGYTRELLNIAYLKGIRCCRNRPCVITATSLNQIDVNIKREIVINMQRILHPSQGKAYLDGKLVYDASAPDGLKYADLP